MIRTHTLGFPRMGAQRQLKFALEKHWNGQIDGDALERIGAELRQRHWQVQSDAGLDFLTVGDFAFYDHVANHIQLLGCEPKRFGFSGREPDLNRYFAMARGINVNASPTHTHDTGCGCTDQSNEGHFPLEMTKWFDTNYHYLVPEFTADTEFRLNSERFFSEVEQAKTAGHKVKAVLLGPLSFLWLGKEKQPGFDRFTLLEQLLPVYTQILDRLKAQSVDWVQMDEPILGLDLPQQWRNAFEQSYWQLSRSAVKIMCATYFSPLQENIRLACQLPVAGLHVDAVRAPHELAGVADWLPSHKVLSVGLVDGRNIWRTDMDSALKQLEPVVDRYKGELWIAPSCSLLHVPYSLEAEEKLDPEIRSWLAFAVEKLDELRVLKHFVEGTQEQVKNALENSRSAIAARRVSTRVHRNEVTTRMNANNESNTANNHSHADQRNTNFSNRQRLQRARFSLPLLPTTTIGSFPQTTEIRSARAAYKQGTLNETQYKEAMRSEIKLAVQKQEALDIDVLVHGEAERNDMVEYFGERLNGFAFTANGWVQSYGSRCVKPPIIYGDVARPQPMTVEWTHYAQSLTTKPMKGMLTGPITILQWSFVRDDQPRSATTLQIAWAIRDEVVDLEQAGIGIIQIDEPAIREGLPLRRADWKNYLTWATKAFRISASGVRDDTQIHTHMCYSEFNDILPDIAAMDADVITIETSRSDMELLRGFGDFKYPNEIGPGVYDIHSPRVPSVEQIKKLIHKATTVISIENLWINPDCGLKTRGWPETEASLQNMMTATKQLREELSVN